MIETNRFAQLEKPYGVMKRLESRLKRAVKGRDDVIDLLLIALLADGHVLLEDYPGSGKTTLARALGDSILDDLSQDEIPGFRRIQFTPDLLPSDITGVSVFEAETGSFHFRRGPIFAYLVLGDGDQPHFAQGPVGHAGSHGGKAGDRR